MRNIGLAIVLAVSVALVAQEKPQPVSAAVTVSKYPPQSDMSVPCEDRFTSLLRDYGYSLRYRESSSQLAKQHDGGRVVFMGDSITDLWNLEKSFPNLPYVNRGIGWEVTGQMLARFRQDVLQLNPRVVVLLAGVNDVGQGVSTDVTESNLSTMAQLAAANGMRVIMVSIMPTTEKWQDRIPNEKIRDLNRWIGKYAKDHGHVYADVWSIVGDTDYWLDAKYTDDGLHPNEAGYARMAQVYAKAIAAAEKSSVGKVSVKGEWDE